VLPADLPGTNPDEENSVLTIMVPVQETRLGLVQAVPPRLRAA
jgi:hypothetical protein